MQRKLMAPALALALLGFAVAVPAAGAPAPQGTSTAASASSSYIVQFRPGAVTDVTTTARRLAAASGGKVGFVYEHVLTGFSVRLPASAVAALRANPAVASVQADAPVRASDTQTNATWGLDRSDQRALPLNGSYTYPAQAGQGAHVYVIDTGINPNHVEFSGRMGTSRNFVAPLLGSTDPNDWDDCNGHGTHVASTAAGTTWGIAKKATVHAVRVLDCQGSGSSSAIIAGMDWVAANKQSPAVANMSLGTVSGRATAIETAARNLVNANVALAVAAGNDNKDACTTSPAAEPTAVTTGATTRTDARASFSNYGTCVDLFAPGDSITAANYSNNTGSTNLSGTSMAAPHVAGALAITRAATPSLTATQAHNAVVNATTTGVVTNPGSGSPNKLLFVGGGTSTPVDAAPTASFTSSCSSLTCSFNAAGSTDDKGIASYAWTFGDGATGSGVAPSRTYAAAATYTVTLTVTDTAGQTATTTRTVSPTAPAAGDPCTGCTKYTGSLASGASSYHPGTGGFSWAGGTLKGYLRGPATADFDLYLERYSCFLTCSWSSAASATGSTSEENIALNASSGTYRWRVTSYSGSGAYTFWGQPR